METEIFSEDDVLESALAALDLDIEDIILTKRGQSNETNRH